MCPLLLTPSWVLPFPFNPLPPFPFPFVGMAERPIPVDTRLKPNPPGLFAEGVSSTSWKLRVLILTAVVGVEASIQQDVLNLSQIGSGYDRWL